MLKSTFYIRWHYCKCKAGQICVKLRLLYIFTITHIETRVYQLLVSVKNTVIISATWKKQVDYIMNDLEIFIKQIKTTPEKTEFKDVIEIIDKYYRYTPTRFVNGTDSENIINNAGENEGSCKIFSFAQLHQLDEAQTLNCFGKYYREEVLKKPEGTDHANIRTFIKYGWQQICFENIALEPNK